MQRLKPTAFCETVRHVQVETLVNTMQYSLPEVEAQTTVDTLCDMDGKASVNTLDYSVAEVNADKVGKTLTDVMGASLVC